MKAKLLDRSLANELLLLYRQAFEEMLSTEMMIDSNRNFRHHISRILRETSHYADCCERRYAQKATSQNSIPCECSDPKCPWCHGKHGCRNDPRQEIREPATQQLCRVDMDNDSVFMCEGCANDALTSGLFTLAEDIASPLDE